MLYSMTGYGSSKITDGEYTAKVEIKTLNAKTTDVRVRIPASIQDREMHFRKIVLKEVKRGRIEVIINIETPDGDGDAALNKKLFKKYFKELNQIKEELKIEHSDIMQAILRIPNVVGVPDNEVDEKLMEITSQACISAVESLNTFRAEEGRITMMDLEERVNAIMTLLPQVEPFEVERIPKLRERIYKNLEEFKKLETVDHNRFEQEILFYIEKLDISEEKVRLTQHCKYFLEVLNSKSIEVGKKLSFIAQEMGREINTLGSKAQHMDIQQIVVKMKDELEKIKEQLANVL